MVRTDFNVLVDINLKGCNGCNGCNDWWFLNKKGRRFKLANEIIERTIWECVRYGRVLVEVGCANRGPLQEWSGLEGWSKWPMNGPTRYDAHCVVLAVENCIIDTRYIYSAPLSSRYEPPPHFIYIYFVATQSSRTLRHFYTHNTKIPSSSSFLGPFTSRYICHG